MEKQTNTSSSLTGKKVILLGGSSGFGLATAQAAATEGAQVIIVSSNQERINKALQQLPASVQGQAVDLSREANIKSFFEQTGNFDHLVYTAGENLTLNYLSDTDIEKAHSFFNLRFWGALAAVKYASPYINAGGSISLVSGTASLRPGKGWSLGSAICGAMEGVVRALAVELAPIRVNSLVPGMIRTEMWNSFSEAERTQIFKTAGETSLVKLVGEAEDVALGFIYLMKQRFVTGQNLVVDGGAVLV